MDCASNQMNPFLHNPLPSSPSPQALESLFAAADSSPSFHEPKMMNFRGGVRRRRSAAAEAEDGAGEDEEEEEELGSMYRHAGKKRRLAAGQVEYLERSFEVDNKLEPERKSQLAKELGLQPRQVAIWFQNRRARFKTKQLERDYNALKTDFDSLKADFDGLLKEKEMLQNEVSLLTTKLKLRETSNNPNSRPESAPEKAAVAVTLLPCKQEEASSAKSDVSDLESPHCPETEHLTSPGLERSDFSQGEAEDLTGSFLPVADYGFGKAEEGDFHGGSCGGLGLPGLDGQPSYWPWLY